MELTKITSETIELLKNKGYEHVTSTNLSGILSEGDDVKNLFIPFKTVEEVQEYERNNSNANHISMEIIEQEVKENMENKTGISFFVESKYLS